MSGMNPASSDAYTFRRVQELLGLSRAVVRGLIAAGFVAPARGARNEFRFSFQDLMVLRTAHALRRSGIPSRRIFRALAHLKAGLPGELPLSGLRITAVGADVAVHDRSGPRHAESGQLLIDFEVARVDGTVAFMPASAPPRTAGIDWFRQGESLEVTDRAAAEQAYRQAIEAEPSRVQPYLNLGALLCEDGRCADAVALYERAGTLGIEDATLAFNQGVALERIDRLADAVEAYARALRRDAGFADAHYNLAVICEKTGDARGALRHFNAYRRLQQTQGG